MRERALISGVAAGGRLPMAAISLAFHAGLIASLLHHSVPDGPVGTGAKERVVMVQIVAASSPRPGEAKPRPVSERPKKAAPRSRRPVERQTPAPQIVRTAIAHPATPAPQQAAHADMVADGPADAASAAAKTSAAGLRDYGSLVWKRIAERKPKGLRRPGVTLVVFSLTEQGGIASIRIAGSSGSEDLDALALRTVANAAPFDRPPAGATPADLSFRVPFNFR
jgi:TonB family protein